MAQFELDSDTKNKTRVNYDELMAGMKEESIQDLVDKVEALETWENKVS